MRTIFSLLGSFGLTVFLAGCTSTTERIDVDVEVIPGTGLTSQDFRSISQRMARSLIETLKLQAGSPPPKVAYVSMENNSSDDYIDCDAFLNYMQTQLVKHSQGRIVFLDRKIIHVIEKENRDKAGGKRTPNGAQTPYGADFFLTGTVESIDKVAGGEHTTYWNLSFRLVDAGTSKVEWADNYEIKKHSTAGIMRR